MKQPYHIDPSAIQRDMNFMKSQTQDAFARITKLEQRCEGLERRIKSLENARGAMEE